MSNNQQPPPLPGEQHDASPAASTHNGLHPQEVVQQDENEDTEEDYAEEGSTASPLTAFIIAIAVAWAGGWKITWGANIWRTKKALLINDHGLLVRINDLYYGLGMTDRFFDAPFISWLCLIPLFAALGFKGFVFGQGR